MSNKSGGNQQQRLFSTPNKKPKKGPNTITKNQEDMPPKIIHA